MRSTCKKLTEQQAFIEQRDTEDFSQQAVNGDGSQR